MSGIRFLDPRAVSSSITISVPIYKPICIFANIDIHQWENIFIKLRDDTNEIEWKRDYDRCRATIKWAYTCGATLENVANLVDVDEYNVAFTFAFTHFKDMCEFYYNLTDSVNAYIRV